MSDTPAGVNLRRYALGATTGYNVPFIAVHATQGRNMSETEFREEIHLGAQGRLVIPARLRRQLGLRQGDTLIARSEQGRLIVEKVEATRRRLKARFSSLSKDRSLAQELVAERRLEAQRERGE